MNDHGYSTQPSLVAFDVDGLDPTGLVCTWGVACPAERLRIRTLRAFAGGARVEACAERLVARDRISWWHPHDMILETRAGTLVDGAPPWRAAEEEIARASAAARADVASLRLVTCDGSVLVFVLGRNRSEHRDPDAGTLVDYDTTIAAWDRDEGVWRWETSDVDDAMGCRSWLLDHASYELSFDETGVYGVASGRRTRTLHDLRDGKRRPERPSDVLPSVHAPPPRIAPRVLAADPSRTHAVAHRGATIELWDLRQPTVVGSVSLQLIADEATAAVVLDDGSCLVGTSLGRILRLAIPDASHR